MRLRVGECKAGDKRAVPSIPALLWSRPCRGRPLTVFDNIDQAEKMKSSIARIRHTELRSHRTRIKSGRPLTALDNIDQAAKMKSSIVRTRGRALTTLDNIDQAEKMKSSIVKIRGRPLTTYANIDQAKDKKRSLIVIRNKYNIASAIITAIQRSKFKLNLPNRYQQCRYVPIILTETFNFLKVKT